MRELFSWGEAKNFMAEAPFALEIYGRNCAPCVAMAKNLDQASKNFPSLKLAKIEVSKVPEAFLIYNNIKSVPFCIYHNGINKYESLGLRTVSQIEELFKEGE